MAGESAGGWWGSWVTSATKKSAEVLEFMKKDISEFSSAVKTEASTLAGVVKTEVSTISEAVKETLQLDNAESPAGNVKKSVSSFFQQLFEPETIDDQLTPILIQDSLPVAMTHQQYCEHLLIENASTFTDPIPPEESAQFEAWLSVQSIDFEDTGSLASRLASNVALQTKYQELTPDQVTCADFWKRYLYRRGLLLDKLAEDERIKKKEVATAENYPWEREKLGSDIELSEEEQIKILSEYEKEKNLSNQKNVDKSSPDYKIREKKDLVIVDRETPSQSSLSSKESTDGDWEKEFDLEDDEITKNT